MKKSLKVLLTAALSCVLLVAVAGIIKFNFLDTPYDGEPVTYIATNGETITAHFKTDNSVKVSGHDLETIHLTSSPSVSGTQYSNPNDTFVFWTKDNEVTIQKDDIITFKGVKESSSQNTLAGSIWKYTGSLINNEQKSVARGTLIVLNFDNNHLFGEACCNSFFASYQYNEETPTQIAFSNLGSSMMLCEYDVMAQEGHFLDVLSNATSIDISENNLTLRYGTDMSLQFKLFGT